MYKSNVFDLIRTGAFCDSPSDCKCKPLPLSKSIIQGYFGAGTNVSSVSVTFAFSLSITVCTVLFSCLISPFFLNIYVYFSIQ